MTRAIGIDLGTTYTVLATIEKGRPRVVPNAEGQYLTPSVVVFTQEGEVLVGEHARRRAATNPSGTALSIKRRMGSEYTVTANGKAYTPQEISSLILRKVKTDAEAYLGERVDRAVITVPAYFNDRQRQATREAGALVGLAVMRIINEPTAAALAYGLDREEAHTVLVWDLGGGTLDISILELGEGIFQVRAVSGDTWLGGDDFDQRVADWLLGEYRRMTGTDFPQDGAARYGLREVAEKAKRELSSLVATRVLLSPLDPSRPVPLEVELTRERLNRLTADLLGRMEVCARQALADAGLPPRAIDRVLLVGGATRMPAVRDLARSVMGRDPYRYIDPDEVVALGSAIQAGMLLGLIEKAALLDVLPLSLGVETQGGLVARIIARNTPLPASGARIFTTAADDQTSMDIHILQGERELAAENISLGQVQLEGIFPAPRGASRVEVAFEADVDGIVHVSAIDLVAEREVAIKVASTKSLGRDEIERHAREAQRNAEQDRERKAQIQEAIKTENLIAAARMVQDNGNGALSDPSLSSSAAGLRSFRGRATRQDTAEEVSS